MQQPLDANLLRHLGLVPEGQDWRIDLPVRCNLATDLVGERAKSASADTVAAIFPDANRCSKVTYRELNDLSDRLVRAFRRAGLRRGDVVAVHSGARVETILAHLAAYKMGAIVATMSQLFGPDTIEHILKDSGARLLVTEARLWEPLGFERASFGDLQAIFAADRAGQEVLAFWDALDRESGRPFAVADTAAEDPALLIYTSGSTGQPKGILHAHRLWRAYRPSLQLFFDLSLERPGAVFWTPADWAWIGGLVDVVYPSLAFGHKLVASQQRFDALWALDFMAEHGVTHSLMTPTALRRLAQIPNPHRGRDLKLQWIFTGGEALNGETLAWLQGTLGAICNEGYGMSEVNHMIGNCQAVRPARPGSMGWQFPGHRARLIDEDGQEVEPGEPGEIVAAVDDPTAFLGYWRNPRLTAETRIGEWIRTYDLAVMDEAGYYWYRGRKDDLIKSAGYRIGPAEVEDVLVQHPAVAEAAVIGKPDHDRGYIVKAFVRLANDAAPSSDLIAELQGFVRDRLAAYKYPREIEFLAEMPTTSTGKISRSALRKRELAAAADDRAGAA